MSVQSIEFLDWALGSGWAPSVAIFVASLAGSPHCVAMCGGILAGCAKRSLAYHLGRLLGYTVLGGVAGALGQALLPTRFLGETSALLLAGLFVWTAVRLWRGGKAFSIVPFPLLRWTERSLRHFFSRASDERLSAFAVGMLSALLPCGWLHSFALAAVATGSAWQGAAVLVVFWVGTLPALAAFSLVVKRVGPLQRRYPQVTATLLLVAALSTLWVRVGPLVRHPKDSPAALSCHR